MLLVQLLPSPQYIVCENERDRAFAAFPEINTVECSASSSSLLMFDVSDADDDDEDSSPSVRCCSAEDNSWWWWWCGCDTACRVFCQRSCMVWLIKFSKSSSFIELMQSISSFVILICLWRLWWLPMVFLLLVLLLLGTHVIWLLWFRWQSDIPPYRQSANQCKYMSVKILELWSTLEIYIMRDKLIF